MRRAHPLVALLLVSAVLVVGAPDADAATTLFVAPGGDDSGACLDPTTPCETLAAGVSKATAGDTIKVAVGTYVSSASEVVLIDRDLTLLGGWNSGFTAQVGLSTIDGENTRTPVWINGSTTVSMDRFEVVHGWFAYPGIHNVGDLTLTRAVIRDNDQAGVVSRSSIVITETTISGNEGLGLHVAQGTATVTGSTFSGNVTNASSGAAIWVDFTSSLEIANSTISGNQAAAGSALNNDGISVLTNVTITNNVSNRWPNAAIDNTGTVTARNSIVAGNTNDRGAGNCRSGGTYVSEGYNLIGPNAQGGGCTWTGDTHLDIGGDPGLGPLLNNGGPTRTHFPGSASPARDAGNPGAPGTGGATCPATDQRSIDRPQGARCDIGAVEVSPGESARVIRLAGANRYETAVAISVAHFPVPADTQSVFLAVGTDFPDALAGAALAAAAGSPLLLVAHDTIPQATWTELQRLDPGIVWILGGPSAVSETVEQELDQSYGVIRLAGAHRYATAMEIAGVQGDYFTGSDVIVATGVGFADALAAGPLAAQLGSPVLLTAPHSLPDVVDVEGAERIIVVGGTTAVSTAVFSTLQAIQPDTVRLSGANRYETAIAISQFGFPYGSGRAYIATGGDFPDALAGAAAAGWWGAPILLVPGNHLPDAVAAELTRLGAREIIILGGEAVVSSGVELELNQLLGL